MPVLPYWEEEMGENAMEKRVSNRVWPDRELEGRERRWGGSGLEYDRGVTDPEVKLDTKVVLNLSVHQGLALMFLG